MRGVRWFGTIATQGTTETCTLVDFLPRLDQRPHQIEVRHIFFGNATALVPVAVKYFFRPLEVGTVLVSPWKTTSGLRLVSGR